MTRPDILEAERISLSFGGVRAIADINFSVRDPAGSVQQRRGGDPTLRREAYATSI
jgi:hypothetical protein